MTSLQPLNPANRRHRTVAQLCFSRAWGGLEMSTVKMTRLFQEAGYRSLCIAFPDSPIHEALRSAQLNHLTARARDYVSPATTLQLSRWIREYKIEAIFLHSLRDLWLVTPALLRHPEVRLLGFARMFLRGIRKKDLLHTLIYSRLDKLIALSNAQKKLLMECLPLPDQKYVVIPNGVDTQRFQPRPRQTPGPPTVGFIGRLDEQKGCLEFVEAAALVHRKFPEVRFQMVGAETIGGDPFADKVFERIQSLGLSGIVQTLPFRKDVEVLMNSIDVFAMPSYEENFANVLLEALSSGLPCLSTNSGGSPEMLNFGNAGILIEPRSSQSLADGLLKILEDPQLAARLARSARAHALENYDIKQVFSRLESLAFPPEKQKGPELRPF